MDVVVTRHVDAGKAAAVVDARPVMLVWRCWWGAYGAAGDLQAFQQEQLLSYSPMHAALQGWSTV
jgi:hypothetical protein